MKNIYNNIIRRILIGALSLSMLVSVTSCTPSSENTLSTDSGTSPSTTEAPAQDTAKTEITTDVTTDPPKEDDGIISVIAAGDNLVHEAVYTFAETLAERENGKYGDYYFVPMYDGVKEVVQSADLAMINQESQICTSPFEASGYPRFITPPAMGDAVMDAGFNVIITANNHMLDNGDKALLNTVEYWKDKPVITVGTDTSEKESDDIAVFEKDGFKIAILAYTDVINHCYDLDDVKKASEYAKYTYYNSDTAKKQLEKANEIADFVIVSMHWGEEDEFEPDSSQRKIAKDLSKWGADAIIGHHPHVVQPIEWIETDGRKTLCVYSLGNFVSTMLYARNMVGMMVSFDIVTNDGEPYIANVKAIPTVTNYVDHPTKDDLKYRQDVYVCLLEDYTEEKASNHGCNSNESKDVTLDTLKSYITDNVAKEFLPEWFK